MRSTVNHIAPAVMQPEPNDNTSIEIIRQTDTFYGTGVLIHTQSAMEIASWYQTPRNAFAPFASTGTIEFELRNEIQREISGATDSADDRRALRALLMYVLVATQESAE